MGRAIPTITQHRKTLAYYFFRILRSPQIFTFDYIGALFASILFPLVLVPYLGLVKTSFLFGVLNTLVALWLLYAMNAEIPGDRLHKLSAIAVLIFLMLGFAYAETLTGIAEASAYPGKIIFAESTPYQRIVITKQARDLRLFLNSNLQFSSLDEYRYHEALVHPVISGLATPRRVGIDQGFQRQGRVPARSGFDCRSIAFIRA